jgi:hypothetical protein
MPGKEALDHICRAEKCTEAEAIEQLQSAIADRVIMARFSGRLPELPLPWGATHAEQAAGMLSPGLGELWEFAEIHPDGAVTVGQFGPLQFTLPRERVLAIWPILKKSTSANEQKCFKWLIGDLRERGTDQVTKSDRRSYAIEQFGVSIRAFNYRIWPHALKETGLTDVASRAGRKLKRQNRNA